MDRSDIGLEFDFRVCSPGPGPISASTGFQIVTEHRLGFLDSADLIVIPALGLEYEPTNELVEQLHAATERGALVMSLCSGAFVLARAGLLDGRRATTHWKYAERFAADFPAIQVVPDVLYVQDGPVLTSAGTAAGIDLCLHLVRESYGWAAANAIARRMVVPPQRDGGQSQYVARPVRPVDATSLAPVLDWAQAHLDEDLSVTVLADRAAMSPRTFARRFKEETGTTPHHWVLRQRVESADQLLEGGDLSIEEVARLSGFSSSTMLRHHFVRLRGTAPSRYRRAFGTDPAWGRTGATRRAEEAPVVAQAHGTSR